MKRRQQPLLSIDEALKKYWGYDSFRPTQREIIESILAGRDTLALLPTGGGKSLTYQIPAIVSQGVCIVVTPLIALMKDQVDRLRQQGVSAVAVHSGMSMRQIDIALDNCTYGDVKVLYVAPERTTSPVFRMRLNRMPVSLIAIDEAHCISQWGYDFRPSYLKIHELRERLPNVPILALTASATKLVCEDIMKNLKFKTKHLIRGNFSRPNLSYAIRNANDKNELLSRILSSVGGSAIVYTRTRKGCEQISQMLIDSGEEATFYHGGLPHAERSLRQDEWISGEYRVMVATNAFGMGIDKPDVRVVVHYSICDSLEAYYQEAGRAGRDGQRSYAVLIVSPDDIGRVERTLDKEFPSLELVKSLYDKICASLEVGYGEGGNVSYNFDLRQFCRNEHIYSGTLSSAIKILQMNGYITYIDEMAYPSQIMFIVGRDDLYRVRVNNVDLDLIIRVLLRLYDGVFTEFRSIDESRIATISGYTIPHIRELLKRLWRMRLIKYKPTRNSALIYLEQHRLPISDLYISPESYKYRKELYSERLGNMVRYAQNNEQCRSLLLEEYFGVVDSQECGVCDICLARRRERREAGITPNAVSLRDRIIATIGRPPEPATTIKGVTGAINYNSDMIIEEVDKMLQEGLIKIDQSGRITII